jgi:IrrE N-terminal-like domain
MTTPLWAIELAEAFWVDAGGPESFPRRLRSSILSSRLELTIKEMPGLSVGKVERYLAALGTGWTCGQRDRPLRACLAARAGAGFIFLAAEDGPEERTFSLAHELAHFLRHYWQPRCRAAAVLGPGALEVLDGLRTPRREERLHALLAGLAIGIHVHLMSRDEMLTPAVAAAERAADQLAWELLAPAAEVRVRLLSGGARAAEALLCEDFGFPAGMARTYAETLFAAEPAMDPLVLRLKKTAAARRTSPGRREPDSGGAGHERGV